MYIEKLLPNSLKDEEMVLFLRRHPLVLIGQWSYCLLLGLVPLVIYYFIILILPQILNSQTANIILILAASIYSLYIWLFALSVFIDYYLDVWIVSNQRIISIEQGGLFNRRIAEHSLDKIQDVTGVQKGIIETFFGYGDVHIQTAGEVQRFVFRQVHNPFEIARQINNLIQIHENEYLQNNNSAV